MLSRRRCGSVLWMWWLEVSERGGGRKSLGCKYENDIYKEHDRGMI